MVKTTNKINLSNPLILTLFSSIQDSNFQKTGTKQVCQVLPVSLTVTTDAEKDLWVREFVYILLCTGQRSLGIINRSQFLQTVCNFALQSAHATKRVMAPSVVAVKIFFHSKAMVKNLFEQWLKSALVHARQKRSLTILCRKSRRRKRLLSWLPNLPLLPIWILRSFRSIWWWK